MDAAESQIADMAISKASAGKPATDMPPPLESAPIGALHKAPDGPALEELSDTLPQPSTEKPSTPILSEEAPDKLSRDQETPGEPQPTLGESYMDVDAVASTISLAPPTTQLQPPGPPRTLPVPDAKKPEGSVAPVETQHSPSAPSSSPPNRSSEARNPETSELLSEAQRSPDLPIASDGLNPAGVQLTLDAQASCAPKPQTSKDGTGFDESKAELEIVPSSPLSSIGSQLEGDEFAEASLLRNLGSSPASQGSTTTGPWGDGKQADANIEFDYDGPEGRQFLRLKPTASQWEDFPAMLKYARGMGAENDGCFKVVIPNDWYGPLPEKGAEKVYANAYKIRQIKRNGNWQVTTVPSEGTFSSAEPGPECLDTVDAALARLKKMFNKNKDKQIRSVRYRVDVPAWTAEQRLEAGVPEQSPIHPLRGDKLDQTKAIVPGIHTPYVYESGPHFGATFQVHAEDFRLCSLNHLYKGRKIWIVVPSTAVDTAEEAFGRKQKCSQFMRHRAEFFFPEKLQKLGIPYRLVDQRPGETIVILPDAYHEGFSTGYTMAEAKNYAEADWSVDKYQPCEASCELLTAIPAAFMEPLKDGESRLDLFAYQDDQSLHPTKRNHEGGDAAEQRDIKRVKT